MKFCPIILAGGSGTRFWPRSRRARAKQILAVDGDRSMIRATVDRLLPLTQAECLWVITNELLSQTISQQLHELLRDQILCEPVPRNTAPAAGLAAFLMERSAPDTILGIFPADQVIEDQEQFRSTIMQGIRLAAEESAIVVLGIEPNRPETGYGYIEIGEPAFEGSRRVRRFTEKPNRQRAEEFVAAGNYFWNSGMFLWSARTFAEAIREHLSETAPVLQKIADAYGTPQFNTVFRDLYPLCENISIDYAIMEPRSAKGEHRSHLYCLAAKFGWNDLGSWAALYDHQMHRRAPADGNIADTDGLLALESRGNYVFSPGKFVALLGVENLVLVETDDAILVTTRDRSQDVGKLVKQLSQSREDLV